MSEMDPDQHVTPHATAIFDGAKQFGLTDAEVLRTVDQCLSEADRDASVAEFLDELTGVLARDIIRNEQRARFEERGAPFEERRAHSRGSL